MAKTDEPIKSYLNQEFINSADGRTIRMLSEYLEPAARFRKLKIIDAVSFFGSARIKPRRTAQKELKELRAADPATVPDYTETIRKAEKALEMSRYYEDAVELSKKLTKWTMQLDVDERRFIICTGGGPGIMEAANKGARQAGGHTIGLRISLPKEEHVNKFVSPSLGFEFHYFFMRKFWFAYLSKALIVFPGGFGTVDELFEILTLVQTKKMKKNLLIVMYDDAFWKKLWNVEHLVESGMINPADTNLFRVCNTVDEVFDLVTKHFEKYYLKRHTPMF